MDQFDATLRQYAQEEPFSLPEDYAGRIFALCAFLEGKSVKITNHNAIRRWAIGVAAALALFIAVPNLSAPAAAAMEKIPILGAVVKVITFRHYAEDTDHTHEDVSVPELEGGSAAASVNADVKAYTDRLMEQFKTDCADIGEAYAGLDVSYRVVTDTDGWFTLRVDALETQASGYEFSKIYNIDKTTDQVVTLDGLFKPGSDWQAVLTGEVERQMDAQMAEDPEGTVYFKEDFTGIEAGQNYCFDDKGNLVLAFDEYEIAPGSMGAPEFTVEKSVFADLLK